MGKIKLLSAKSCFIIIFAFMIMLAGVFFLLPSKAYAASTPGIIVIDPGHIYKNGVVDIGATALDGTYEKDYNIALASKVATELYSRGYTVYTTLPIGLPPTIPYLMSGTNISLQGRAAASNSKNPDVFISIHHNSAGSTASGAIGLQDIADPKAPGDGEQSADLKAKSLTLADDVMTSVWSLYDSSQSPPLYAKGNRTNKIQYQDVDVIEYSSCAAMTLEAGFLTNAVNLANLKDTSKQQAMAVKVADGIAEYFKTYPGKYSQPQLSMISLDGTNPDVTYNPNFSMAANIDSAGKTISSMFFNVYNADVGRQTSVYFGGTKDIFGTWRATFDFSKYNYVTGNYVVEVYAMDSDGNTYGLGGKAIRVVNTPPEMTMISLDGTNPDVTYNKNFSLAANINAKDKTIIKMFFNIYNADIGRQTSVYYYGAKDIYGTWRANFDFSKQGYGNFVVEVYVMDSNGILYSLGGKMIRLADDPPVMSMISLDSTNPASTYSSSFPMAANINPRSKTISSMFFNVYNMDIGRQTSVYYYGSKDIYGTWRATFDLSKQQNIYGNYNVEAYVIDSDGVTYGLGSKSIRVVNAPPEMTMISIDGTNPASTTNPYFSMAANINAKSKTISSMFFNVYNADVGRQTSKYFYGAKDVYGTWRANFDFSKFGFATGNYVVEVYVTDSAGVTYGLGGKSIRVVNTPPEMTMISLDGSNPASTFNADFSMAANIDSRGKTISSMFFNVYNADIGRQTSVYYYGTKDVYGTWRASFDLSKYGYKYGNYVVEVYATDSQNVTYGLGGRSIQIKDTPPEMTMISLDGTNPDVTYNTAFSMATNINPKGKTINSMFFNVYNADIGRQTSRYYYGAKDAYGTWRATFNLADYADKYGNYVVEVYATDSNNVTYGLGGKAIYINQKSSALIKNMGFASAGQVVGSTTYLTSFEMNASFNEYGIPVNTMYFYVYNTAIGSSSGVTYYAAKGSDGIWRATFDLARHGGAFSTYRFDAYVIDAVGTHSYGGVPIDVKLGTEIMGTPRATVNQMVNYYLSSGYTFPDYYVQRGVTLQKFAQDYFAVCSVEGVRPEVAWVQMCLETKYLQFGNLVSTGQFNFAGLGATGPGNPGFNFAAVYGDNEYGMIMGMYGHVQHLKLYACTSNVSYSGGIIDPRWSAAVSAGYRGLCPSLEALSGKWASSLTYGTDLANALAKLMSISSMSLGDTLPAAIVIEQPTVAPTAGPSAEPTVEPSEEPTVETTDEPFAEPTTEPTTGPTEDPSVEVESTEKPLQLQTEEYGIMAQAEDMELTKEQLAKFYTQNASGIPMTLTDEAGALLQVDTAAFPLYYGMSLDEFIGIIIQEADREGVRPEVVFAQIMADTNFLRFGETLKIKDYVFADNQAGEETYTDEQYGDAAAGIRAAVQHLKCLASTEALKETVADVLWQDALRGTTASVQGLHHGDEMITLLQRIFNETGTS